MNYIISLYGRNALDPVLSIPTAAWYTTHIVPYLALTGAGVLNPVEVLTSLPV
jgi:hypothetical protein